MSADVLPTEKAAKLAASLETAEAGQLVCLYSGYGHERSLAEIERTTPTKIVVAKIDFNRSGYLRGVHSWESSSIKTVDAEVAAKIIIEQEIRTLTRYIANVQWSTISLPVLRKVREALRP